MVLKIFEYIGDQIKTKNPYLDSFSVNCIKIGNDKIVNFIGAEKESFVPSDIAGTAGYIRLDPNITYKDAKLTSCVKTIMATIKFKAVIFSINQSKRLHPVKVEQKISGDLSSLTFEAYTGPETDIQLLVNNSNISDIENLKQEIGDIDIPAESVVVGINGTLSFKFNPACQTETCDVFEEIEC